MCTGFEGNGDWADAMPAAANHGHDRGSPPEPPAMATPPDILAYFPIIKLMPACSGRHRQPVAQITATIRAC